MDIFKEMTEDERTYLIQHYIDTSYNVKNASKEQYMHKNRIIKKAFENG